MRRMGQRMSAAQKDVCGESGPRLPQHPRRRPIRFHNTTTPPTTTPPTTTPPNPGLGNPIVAVLTLLSGLLGSLGGGR
jgi:hypothetical protein